MFWGTLGVLIRLLLAAGSDPGRLVAPAVFDRLPDAVGSPAGWLVAPAGFARLPDAAGSPADWLVAPADLVRPAGVAVDDPAVTASSSESR